jgi:hypothetical protein
MSRRNRKHRVSGCPETQGFRSQKIISFIINNLVFRPFYSLGGCPPSRKASPQLPVATLPKMPAQARSFLRCAQLRPWGSAPHPALAAVRLGGWGLRSLRSLRSQPQSHRRGSLHRHQGAFAAYPRPFGAAVFHDPLTPVPLQVKSGSRNGRGGPACGVPTGSLTMTKRPNARTWGAETRE